MAPKKNNGMMPKKVMEDIFKLVRSVDNMIQNFHSIRKPLIDSSNSVPEATKQLDKVTKETEKATHRMLDLIEGITDKEIDTLSLVEELLEQSDSMEEAQVEKLEHIRQNAEEAQNDSFLIMDSLQFQDITTQQIHHAGAILEAIEEKLKSLLTVIGEAFDLEGRSSRSYDPNATIEGSATRQQNVDELIKSMRS